VPYDYTLPSEPLPNTLEATSATLNFSKPNVSFINADSLLQARKADVDYGPGAINPNWHSLNPEQRKLQARYMELYAGMVSNLDHNIGLLIQHLKAIGQYDNTFIIFHSDNGPDGSPVSPEQEAANAAGFDNLGKDQGLNPSAIKSTYVQYGRRWAEVSATPFRLVKGFTTEGGTSVPTIVHLPSQHQAYPPVREFTHVTDIVPTLLELVGIAPPMTSADA
jgi:arylsulfatase A-like enzyme